jgi:hypothetical protein
MRSWVINQISIIIYIKVLNGTGELKNLFFIFIFLLNKMNHTSHKKIDVNNNNNNGINYNIKNN